MRGLKPQVSRGRPATLVLAFCSLPLLVCGYQVTSKWLAQRIDAAPPGAWLSALLSGPTLPALLICEGAGFAVWMYVLSRVQLSEAFPLSALSYCFVVLASWSIFHESVSFLQIVGSVAIVSGAWLIGSGGER